MKLLALDDFINYNQFFDLDINLARETKKDIIEKYREFKQNHQLMIPKMIICGYVYDGNTDHSYKLNELLDEGDRVIIAQLSLVSWDINKLVKSEPNFHCLNYLWLDNCQLSKVDSLIN